MDTSEEYVEMCRKAEEIQESWEVNIDDVCIDMGDVWTIRTLEMRNYVHWAKEKDTWIPRQDQLQDMCIELKKFKPIFSLDCVTMWAEAPGVDCGSNDYAKSLNSFEQVWLAYVMDELYGKKWNGSEWVQ